jgi:DNA-binding Xre family transcriptional regulator
MNSTDLKILELIDFLVNTGKIVYAKDFCAVIGIPKQSITRIKQGKAHFTAEHIANVCKMYNVNANWIFGTQKNRFNPSKASTAKELA